MPHDSLAIVTGTSSGIGSAVARVLLDDGWQVLGLSRRAVARAHTSYTHLAIDLGDESSLRSCADPIARRLREQQWGRVGLVNNAAATGTMGPLEDLDPAAFAQVLAINVIGPVFLTGLVLREAPTAAALRIVNVSTGAATTAFPGLIEYASSKAALRMATMITAAELASAERPAGVRSNVAVVSYAPGIVDTPMQTRARAPGQPWNRMFKEFHEQGRLVTPDAPAEEIARFLNSDSEPAFSERRFGS